MSPRLRSLVVLTLLGLPCTSLGYELRKDSLGDVVHWGAHVEFVIDEQFAIQLKSSQGESAAKAALATVADATPGLSVTWRVAPSLGMGYQQDKANQNDIMVLTDDWPFDTKALAATVVTVNTRTKEMVDADIVFNGEEHAFGVVDSMPSNSRPNNLNDIQNTLTHELGHALGLMHNASDARVVMYPSAPPLEMTKRVFAQDDLDGLVALYGAQALVPTPTPAPVTGCSSASGISFGALLVAMLTLLRRRRLVPVVLAAVVPTLARADDRVPDFAAATHVALAEVKEARSVESPEHRGLFMTELTLSVRECLKGGCAATMTVQVPGGRIGELEQVIDHAPVPALATTVLVAREKRAMVVQVTPERRATFANALTAAKLAVPVSCGPQAAQTPTTNVPKR